MTQALDSSHGGRARGKIVFEDLIRGDGIDVFIRDLASVTRDRTIDEIKLLPWRANLFFVAALSTDKGERCGNVDLYRVAAG